MKKKQATNGKLSLDQFKHSQLSNDNFVLGGGGCEGPITRRPRGGMGEENDDGN